MAKETTIKVPLSTSPKTEVTWNIYYFHKRDNSLRCMERHLPSNMSKEGLREYIARMGHTIDKAISDEIIYTY